MEITEVRVYPRNKDSEKVKAYVTITFDNSFVVRDLKILNGKNGLFVAMPSRKLRVSCSKCGYKNRIHSKFCNSCGTNIESINSKEEVDKKDEHKDIAHPITSEMRNYLQDTILKAYEKKIQEGGSDSAGGALSD
ncbi:septation protein SpoVG family protein [Candidatus Desantisbacteria bacterium]|nr:septation protein SpoVG family protein [Candidatus Desantisbacteria bacterium]